ncbi:MAG: NACHT domain-containing protein, partial [Kangiellaceae bacterium]|nr:NACHT domain-containing protein [Kangiellaceae bacterium]
MAYEWSHGSRRDHPSGLANIHKFDLVFYLKAEDLKHQDSIAEAIRCHLLPEDFKMSLNNLEELLQTTTVLFLIDAYDEACVDNLLLEKLIEKKHLRKSSLLLTSRRHFLRDKLNYFNCRLSLEGYDKTQQLNHVK